MVLTTHPVSGTNESIAFGSQVTAYEIGGLPQGEHAVIAEFPDQGWRILRWNAAWHGNWTGNYISLDAAVQALREQLLTPLS
jgi:hypothetical protein